MPSPTDDRALLPATRELLEALGQSPAAEAFYLAGSAALSLYAGHRPVRDADLMAGTNRLAPADRRDLLELLLEADRRLRVETARNGLLAVRSEQGPRLRFYYYPYPLVAPFETAFGLEIASPIDLGLMKLGAIISRGTRRDFVDLYLLHQVVPVDRILEGADAKFGHVRDFTLQAIKALADRSEAGGPMPRLTRDLDWSTVEAWLDGVTARLSAGHLGPL